MNDQIPKPLTSEEYVASLEAGFLTALHQKSHRIKSMQHKEDPIMGQMICTTSTILAQVDICRRIDHCYALLEGLSNNQILMRELLTRIANVLLEDPQDNGNQKDSRS
jgi:hypothetical protein